MAQIYPIIYQITGKAINLRVYLNLEQNHTTFWLPHLAIKWKIGGRTT
jgi:hypothetical protein